MKKLLALTLVAGSAIGMATACGASATASNTGEAFGLVHGTIAGETTAYVGIATVTVKDNKIASVKIDETITKTYGTTDGTGNTLKTGMTDIKGKDLDWAKSQLAVDYAYSLKSYQFTKDMCYSVELLNYTGIAAADSSACTTAKGTWLAAGSRLDFTKSAATLKVGVFANGDAYVVPTDSVTTDGTFYSTAKKGVNSKLTSQGTEYGYWDPANRTSSINGWAWNMTIIQNNFVGLTWDDIANKNYISATGTAGTDAVAGATASDKHQYAEVVKAAAKVAFGK